MTSLNPGTSDWLSIPIIKPMGHINPKTSTPIVITFANDQAPYGAYSDTTQRSIGTLYYNPSSMNLKKMILVVSRSVNNLNSTSPAKLSLLRSDTLDYISTTTITSGNLQIIEVDSFTNLPTSPMILDIVVEVSNPKTNIQVHSISFYV